MKKIFLVITLIAGLVSCRLDNGQQSTVNGHNHEHSATCNHDHEGHNHDHNHDHEAEAHNHNHDGHNHNHEAKSQQPATNSHAHDHGEGSINFPIDQQKKIDFEVVEVVTEPLYQVIRTSAQIVPSQESEKILTATTSGIVTFESKDIVQGLEVKSGQVLFSIDNDEMADGSLEIRRQEIEADYEKAKADYERKQSLAEDKIISESELLDAKA